MSSPEKQIQPGEKAQGLIREWAPTVIDREPPLQARKQGCGFYLCSKTEEWRWMERAWSAKGREPGALVAVDSR